MPVNLTENTRCECPGNCAKPGEVVPVPGACQQIATMILYQSTADHEGTAFCDSCGFAQFDANPRRFFEADELHGEAVAAR